VAPLNQGPPIEELILREKIAVVIPSFNVRDHIASVIDRVGPEVCVIYIVDDACPQGSGAFIESSTRDDRVRVIFNASNLGVGGATLVGMQRAASEGADVIVKIDGDGQMDPALIPNFVGVILAGEADYSKGNRFFEPEGVSRMPLERLLGNAALSFLCKISSGYWQIVDPTNGFIAIHASIVALLPLDKIAKRYFFESDMLFRLNILGARVVDIPMHSYYGDEISGMKPHREILGFTLAHMRNFSKRVVYNYFIRGFSLASLELIFGLVFCFFGFIYGIANWKSDIPATAGTVMVAALPIILGFQLLLAFVNYDIQSIPRLTLHLRIKTSALPMRPLLHRDSPPNKS
jgi:dolichol-phosphate mannosyltransferase